MEQKAVNKYDYNILLSVFAGIPIVDFINGTLITMLNLDSDISIGKFYRIFTMLVMVYIVLKYSNKSEKKKHMIIISITAMIIIFYLLIFFNYHRSFKGMIADGISISKLLLIFIIVYSMYFLSKNRLISIDIINKIFNFYLIIFPITMLVPYILRVGSSTYSSGLGYTGLYYANNDLSITLLVSTIYGINNLIVKKDIKSIILATLNLMSLLLVGSKTGILGLFLAILLYLIFYMKKIARYTKSISKKNKMIIFIILILIFPSHQEPI